MPSPDDIFNDFTLGEEERLSLDKHGHLLFPGLLTADTSERLINSLRQVTQLGKQAIKGHEPQRFSAEFDEYLASLINHPQMLMLARNILGEDIRYDHCVSLVRPAGTPAMPWHSHEYAEDDPGLGFIRIFFYISGFTSDDGGLKVVPGSHLYRDRSIGARTDDELRKGWIAGKRHPETDEELKIEHLNAPPGSVIIMWTHAAHGVVARKLGSTTRYCVVYAYRNPGRASDARWISAGFESRPPPGCAALMPLY